MMNKIPEPIMHRVIYRLVEEGKWEGQGRFLLNHPFELHIPQASKTAEALNKWIREKMPEWAGGMGITLPWTSVRVVKKRYSMPDPKSESGLKILLDIRLYLELILPSNHTKSAEWTGISPKDKEWGALPRIHSSGKTAESRKGVHRRRGVRVV